MAPENGGSAWRREAVSFFHTPADDLTNYATARLVDAGMDLAAIDIDIVFQSMLDVTDQAFYEADKVIDTVLDGSLDVRPFFGPPRPLSDGYGLGSRFKGSFA